MLLALINILHRCDPLAVCTHDFESKTPLHWAMDRESHNPLQHVGILHIYKLYPCAALQNATVEKRSPFFPNTVEGYIFWSPVDKLIGHAKEGNYVSITILRIMLNGIRQKLDSILRTHRADMNWTARKHITMALHATAQSGYRSSISPVGVQDVEGLRVHSTKRHGNSRFSCDADLFLYCFLDTDVWATLIAFL